jgi:hypothetical protein
MHQTRWKGVRVDAKEARLRCESVRIWQKRRRAETYSRMFSREDKKTNVKNRELYFFISILKLKLKKTSNRHEVHSFLASIFPLLRVTQSGAFDYVFLSSRENIRLYVSSRRLFCHMRTDSHRSLASFASTRTPFHRVWCITVSRAPDFWSICPRVILCFTALFWVGEKVPISMCLRVCMTFDCLMIDFDSLAFYRWFMT